MQIVKTTAVAKYYGIECRTIFSTEGSFRTIIAGSLNGRFLGSAGLEENTPTHTYTVPEWLLLSLVCNWKRDSSAKVSISKPMVCQTFA